MFFINFTIYYFDFDADQIILFFVVATAEIYHNFWEAKRSASSEIESFALLDKYIEACQDNITKLKVVISKLPIKEHK